MAGGPSLNAKIAAMALAGVIGLGILAETTAHVLGSGRLLYRADPEIEYLPQPNQAVVVRNVDMRTNAWGMRSDPVEAVRPADAFRVMVIGDGVVFGFTNIRHSSLATSQLAQIETEDGRRLEVLECFGLVLGAGERAGVAGQVRHAGDGRDRAGAVSAQVRSKSARLRRPSAIRFRNRRQC